MIKTKINLFIETIHFHSFLPLYNMRILHSEPGRQHSTVRSTERNHRVLYWIPCTLPIHVKMNMINHVYKIFQRLQRAEVAAIFDIVHGFVSEWEGIAVVAMLGEDDQSFEPLGGLPLEA